MHKKSSRFFSPKNVNTPCFYVVLFNLVDLYVQLSQMTVLTYIQGHKFNIKYNLIITNVHLDSQHIHKENIIQ